MIVQCPSCASRYRVNDANVPASGGKITCPSCQHKFIVYPEEQNPAAGSAPSNDLEDKTSVAFRPDLNKLVDQMQRGGGAQPGGEDGVAATEVMSGDQIPDFLNGQDIPDDGTVEMKNPFGEHPFADSPLAAALEEDAPVADAAPTEVVSGEMLDDMEFDSPKSAPTASQQAQPPAQPQGLPQVPGSPTHPAQQDQQTRQDDQTLQDGQAQPSQPAGEAPSFDQYDAPAGPDPDHDGPWKLKTNFGLTYEFPDTKSLKSWMSNREELDGHELSGDGETFHTLDAWPQLSAGGGAGAAQQIPSFQQDPSPQPAGLGQPRSSGQASSSGQAGSPGQAGGFNPSSNPNQPGGFGASNNPGSGPAGLPGNSLTPSGPPPSMPAPSSPSGAPGKKIKPKEFRPPSRDGKWNMLLWAIAFVLLLVVGGLVVQLFGIYDLKGAVLGTSSAQAEASSGEAPADDQLAQGGADDEHAGQQESGLDPEIAEKVTQMVDDARRAVENNRLQTAAAKLQNAKLLDPERVEVYRMLATVYDEMGQEAEAEAARTKAGELQGAADAPGQLAGEEASKN